MKLRKIFSLKVLVPMFLWIFLATLAYFSFIILGIGNTTFIYEGV